MDEINPQPRIAAIRAELARILASGAFDASDRNRSFLRHVVEETLDGRGERIKAYAIATTVFGRGTDFDPQVDSIVRIEAGRLRRSLERYYLTEGRADPVVIGIPKGSYIPGFAFHDAPLTAAPAKPASGAPASVALPDRPAQGPAIAVLAFEPEGDQSAFPNLTAGFTRELVVGLTRFRDLCVFGPVTGAALPDPSRPSPDYLLSGGTSLSDDALGVEALLTDARSGRCVWAESLNRRVEPGGLAAARGLLANRIAQSLGQPFGVIFTDRAAALADAPAGDPTPEESRIRFHQYLRSFDRTTFAETRRGLEAVLARDPGQADAHACLSLIWCDAHRFRYETGAEAALAPALRHARRAVDAAPQSSRGHHALGLALWFSGDLAGSLEAFETGLRLNPNDTHIMADLGQRLAMRMDWDRAVPLIETAYRANPGLPRSYRIGLGLYHYAEGRFAEAIAEARGIGTPSVVYGWVLVAACAARLGCPKLAQEAVAEVRAVDPGYGRRMAADLDGRLLHPRLAAAIVGDAERAGLGGPPTRGAGPARPKSVVS